MYFYRIDKALAAFFLPDLSFPPAELGRPALFFQPDRADYDAERGLYFDPDKSPLLVAHTEEELLALLSRPIDGPGNCKAVLDFLGTHESGHASEAVARRIAELL